MRIEAHKHQQGFVSIAQNTTVDYLSMAYVQAMNIKSVMPGSRYAVIVDSHTNGLITEQHSRVFDYVIVLPEDHAENQTWKLNNEWQVYWLTPFKETIKLEADLLFPTSIEHWWTAFRLRDVVLSTGCRDYQGKPATSRAYRKLFDDNDLPDVYNGLMYFRYSRTAEKFFVTAQELYRQWNQVAPELIKVRGQATTDVVYALASRIVGPELTTLPSADFINFTHMKPAINEWENGVDFHHYLNVVVDAPMIRVNNVQQHHPFHYYFKDFLNKELIAQYEQLFESTRSLSNS